MHTKGCQLFCNELSKNDNKRPPDNPTVLCFGEIERMYKEKKSIEISIESAAALRVA